ncbi:hypothetical protein BG000_011708 [Podila horticola]|nr:hypothetical protein BG000_011708 [Podila horticola]
MLSGPEAVYRMHRRTGAAIGEHQLRGMHSNRAQKRHRHAIRHFKESLELNPFLWEAFENLCELGTALDGNIEKPSLTLNKPAEFVLSKPNFATPMLPNNRALTLTLTGTPVVDE